MDVDHSLACHKRTEADRTGQTDGHCGTRQKQNPEWDECAAQEFRIQENKKILHSGTFGVYPNGPRAGVDRGNPRYLSLILQQGEARKWQRKKKRRLPLFMEAALNL
jgi:hypothetical protein